MQKRKPRVEKPPFRKGSYEGGQDLPALGIVSRAELGELDLRANSFGDAEEKTQGRKATIPQRVARRGQDLPALAIVPRAELGGLDLRANPSGEAEGKTQGGNPANPRRTARGGKRALGTGRGSNVQPQANSGRVSEPVLGGAAPRTRLPEVGSEKARRGRGTL